MHQLPPVFASGGHDEELTKAHVNGMCTAESTNQSATARQYMRLDDSEALDTYTLHNAAASAVLSM